MSTSHHSKPPETVTLTIRLPDWLRGELREVAEKSDRSMSWHIRMAVADYLAARENSGRAS